MSRKRRFKLRSQSASCCKAVAFECDFFLLRKTHDGPKSNAVFKLTQLFEKSCINMRIHATPLKPRGRDLVGHFEQKLLTVQNISLPSHGSRSVLNVGSDIFQLGEDLGEEAGLSVDPEHWSA